MERLSLITFSLSVVFDLSSADDIQDLIIKLGREIPNKPKLIVTGRAEVGVLPETLLVNKPDVYGLTVTFVL